MRINRLKKKVENNMLRWDDDIKMDRIALKC